MMYKILLNPTQHVSAMQAVMSAVGIRLIDVGFFEQLYAPHRTYEAFREHLDRNFDNAFAASSVEVEHTHTVQTRKGVEYSYWGVSFYAPKESVSIERTTVHCKSAGYDGVVPPMEFLIPIHDLKTIESLLNTARAYGMIGISEANNHITKVLATECQKHRMIDRISAPSWTNVYLGITED